MGDDFIIDVQAEEENFWSVLTEMIYSLPVNEREEIIGEIIKFNEP